MDIIELAREIGRELQKDERYPDSLGVKRA